MEIFENNGFKYTASKEEGISILHNQTLPEKLFKFYSIKDYNIEALEESYLYASSIYELNDFLDCNKEILYSRIQFEKSIYNKFVNDSFSKETNIVLGNIVDKMFENDSNNNRNKTNLFLNYLLTTFAKTFGIISLTEEEDNLLMWPLYATESGFQIEFEVEKLISSIKMKNQDEIKGPYPINYQRNGIKRYDLCGNPNLLLNSFNYLTNVKDEKWGYEKEWRFVLNRIEMNTNYKKNFEFDFENFIGEKNRKTFYSTNSILNITLGASFFNNDNCKIDRHNNNKTIGVYYNEFEENNESIILDFIIKNLNSEFFWCVVAINTDDRLVRSKKKFKVSKIKNKKYLVEKL